MLRFDANISLLFREYDIVNRFEAAKQAGFDAVEILSPESASITDLVSAANKAEIEIVLCNAPVGDLLKGGPGLSAVPGRQKTFMEAIDETVPVVKAFQCSRVNIGPSIVRDGDSREDCYTALAENLCYAGDVLSAVGAKALIEPLNTNDRPGIFLSTIDEALQIMEMISHPNVYLQFDVYHMHQMETSCIEKLKAYINKIEHIQIADCPGRHEPGTGEIDFHGFFDVLESLEYRGWIGVEYIPSMKTEDTLSWMYPYI